MRIGYARVSTADQSLDMQVSALEGAGCERIYREQASGRRADRPELERMLAFLREGDTLVVWKLDRLGRSVRQLVDLIVDLDEQGIGFESLTESFDTSTPMGRCMVNICAAFAQMEADLIRERTVAGLEEARRAGRTGGRPAVDDARLRRAAQLIEAGQPVRRACAAAGISTSTWYRHRQRRYPSVD